MTTYSWTNISGGSWFTTSNWSPGGTPGASDTVVVNAAGAYGIAVDTTSASVLNLSFLGSAPGAVLTFSGSHSLTLIGALSLAAGSVNVNTAGTGIAAAKGSTSSLSISGGTLLESAGSVAIGTGGVTVSAGSVTLSGGSLNDTGTLGVSGGTFTINGAQATISGAATFTGGGVTIQSGTFTAKTVTIGGTANTVTLSGGKITTASGGTGASILAGNTLSMSGSAILDLSNGGGSFAGTLTGAGTVKGSLTGSGGTGAITASGGTLDLTSAITSTNLTYQIAASSTLELDGTVASGNTFGFLSSASGTTLEFAALAGNTFSGITLNGLNVNTSKAATNEINVKNVAFDTAHLTATDAHNGTLTLTSGGSTVGTFALTNTTGAALTSGFVDWQTDPTLGGQDIFLSTVVCFAAGTRILTAHGQVAVEDLAEGDRVVTHTGQAQPITWIGHRRIELALHPRPQLVAPVRIRRDAFGESLPQRDLLVSPDHCLFVDGKLIPAKLLINGMTIVHELSARSADYYHVELDRHAILLAEGLPTESYLDTGNRAYFANSGLAMVLHPEFTVNAALKAWETDACAPLTVQPELVAPIWQGLAERAEALGFVAPQPETTRDPALHLLADGRTIRPLSVQAGRYVFALPASSDSVRLLSRAGMPSELCAYVNDWRQLGVAVTRVVVRAQESHAVIPADHPDLTSGWHTVESDGVTSWRWTNGDAELRLDAAEGPVIVEVHVCNTAAYILAETPGCERLAA